MVNKNYKFDCKDNIFWNINKYFERKNVKKMTFLINLHFIYLF